MSGRISPRLYAFDCLKHSVPAVFIGILVDKFLKRVQEKYDVKPLVIIIVQTVILFVILYFIEITFTRYAQDWQETTPGIFFTFFLFCVQFNFFDNIKKVCS